MSFLVALAVFVVTVALFVPRFLQAYRRKREIAEAIDYYPGEKWYPIIGTGLKFITTSREDAFDYMRSRHKTYGPVFRSWFQGEPIIHICKAEHAELFLKSNVNINKGMIYRYFEPWLGTGLLTGGGNKWRTHRKLITPAFHFSILDKFAEIFAERADDLVHILEDKVGKGYFDINPYVTKCALDIIAETSMGKKVYALKDPKSKYVDAIVSLCEISARRYTNPVWANDFLFKFTKAGKRFFDSIDHVNGITLKIIAEKREQLAKTKSTIRVDELGRKERQAFIDILLNTEGEKRFTDAEIIEEVNTFMFAGQDTSSITTGFTLFALGNTPEIQAKVHEELDAIFEGSDRIITPQDIASLDYLDRVVKETMRYYYFVPEIGRCLSEELVLDGHRIPADTTVILDLYELHHDPEYYPEPFKFDPDRFLPEEVAKRHVYAYVPFSAGPRNCVGQKFGLRNAKTMLASILRKFKVKSRDRPQDLKYYIEAVLRPQQGLQIQLELRK
ncbi:cytochrome P450 4C1-like [Cylas formicarius]|uniref:cytochrome P450 4C1-like n=1 Tax=Cylas formicarius TaxID=197179 RepID=UPI002958A57E|nr:cytochrome P450 4C1-like [Cylas formicarius]